MGIPRSWNVSVWKGDELVLWVSILVRLSCVVLRSCLSPLVQHRPHAVWVAGCPPTVIHMFSHPHPGSPRPLHSFKEGKSGRCQVSTACIGQSKSLLTPSKGRRQSGKGCKKGGHLKSTTYIRSDMKEKYKENLMKEIHSFHINVFYLTLKILKFKSPNHESKLQFLMHTIITKTSQKPSEDSTEGIIRCVYFIFVNTL